MDKWSLELTKSQLELVQWCVSVHADILDEDLKADKIAEVEKESVERDIKDAAEIRMMTHLGLVSFEVGEEAERQSLKKGVRDE